MLTPTKKNTSSIKGFTLMEIIITLIVIAIIAAMAIPSFSTTIERNKTSEAFQILGALKNAQMIYQLENGSFTNNIGLLDISIPSSPNYNAPTLGTVATSLASVQRSSNYTYTLSIDNTGLIKCSGSDCSTIGCTHGAGSNECN